MQRKNAKRRRSCAPPTHDIFRLHSYRSGCCQVFDVCSACPTMHAAHNRSTTTITIPCAQQPCCMKDMAIYLYDLVSPPATRPSAIIPHHHRHRSSSSAMFPRFVAPAFASTAARSRSSINLPYPLPSIFRFVQPQPYYINIAIQMNGHAMPHRMLPPAGLRPSFVIRRMSRRQSRAPPLIDVVNRPAIILLSCRTNHPCHAVTIRPPLFLRLLLTDHNIYYIIKMMLI